MVETIALGKQLNSWMHFDISDSVKFENTPKIFRTINTLPCIPESIRHLPNAGFRGNDCRIRTHGYEAAFFFPRFLSTWE